MDHRTSAAEIRFPVSVKGVLLAEGGVVLLENEREEWDLPGAGWKRRRARKSA